MLSSHWVLLSTLLCAGLSAAQPVASLPAQDVVRRVDARMRTPGDWRSLVLVDEVQADRRITREMVIFRRPQEDKFLLLISRPRTEEGNGYLRLERNLFSYDPKTGKWERRTERERIAGTNARRRDFDESRLAQEYNAEDEGTEKVGAVVARKLKLTVKEGLEVAFPQMRIWVDPNFNLIKTQEFALSGKLLRTSLMPRHEKLVHPVSKAEFWSPKEVRIYDEVEKDRVTTLLFKAVDLRPLEQATFTKAWLESKSR